MNTASLSIYLDRSDELVFRMDYSQQIWSLEYQLKDYNVNSYHLYSTWYVPGKVHTCTYTHAFAL